MDTQWHTGFWRIRQLQNPHRRHHLSSHQPRTFLKRWTMISTPRLPIRSGTTPTSFGYPLPPSTPFDLNVTSDRVCHWDRGLGLTRSSTDSTPERALLRTRLQYGQWTQTDPLSSNPRPASNHADPLDRSRRVDGTCRVGAVERGRTGSARGHCH